MQLQITEWYTNNLLELERLFIESIMYEDEYSYTEEIRKKIYNIFDLSNYSQEPTKLQKRIYLAITYFSDQYLEVINKCRNAIREDRKYKLDLRISIDPFSSYSDINPKEFKNILYLIFNEVTNHLYRLKEIVDKRLIYSLAIINSFISNSSLFTKPEDYNFKELKVGSVDEKIDKLYFTVEAMSTEELHKLICNYYNELIFLRMEYNNFNRDEFIEIVESCIKNEEESFNNFVNSGNMESNKKFSSRLLNNFLKDKGSYCRNKCIDAVICFNELVRNNLSGTRIAHIHYADLFNFLIGMSGLFEIWIFRKIAESKIPVVPNVEITDASRKKWQFDFIIPLIQNRIVLGDITATKNVECEIKSKLRSFQAFAESSKNTVFNPFYLLVVFSENNRDDELHDDCAILYINTTNSSRFMRGLFRSLLDLLK